MNLGFPNEAEFKNWVINQAKVYGWLVHHDLPAQARNGRWATHVQGHAGFPDLVLLHPSRGELLFVELKSERGKISTVQDTWLMALNLAGAENHVWRPQDVKAIQRRLAPAHYN